VGIKNHRITDKAPLGGIPQRTWNRFAEAADVVLDSNARAAVQKGTSPSIYWAVINNTGGDRRSWDCVSIDGMQINETDNQNEYEHRPTFQGGTPSEVNKTKFAILQKPAKAGQVVNAAFHGPTLAWVDIKEDPDTQEEYRTFAEVDASSGEHRLRSAKRGGTRIVYAPPGTGEKLCWVILEYDATAAEDKDETCYPTEDIIVARYYCEDNPNYESPYKLCPEDPASYSPTATLTTAHETYQIQMSYNAGEGVWIGVIDHPVTDDVDGATQVQVAAELFLTCSEVDGWGYFGSANDTGGAPVALACDWATRNNFIVADYDQTQPGVKYGGTLTLSTTANTINEKCGGDILPNDAAINIAIEFYDGEVDCCAEADNPKGILYEYLDRYVWDRDKCDYVFVQAEAPNRAVMCCDPDCPDESISPTPPGPQCGHCPEPPEDYPLTATMTTGEGEVFNITMQYDANALAWIGEIDHWLTEMDGVSRVHVQAEFFVVCTLIGEGDLAVAYFGAAYDTGGGATALACDWATRNNPIVADYNEPQPGVPYSTDLLPQTLTLQTDALAITDHCGMNPPENNVTIGLSIAIPECQE
jgi:hypothetical protein